MAIDWDAEAKRRVAARVAGFNKRLDKLGCKPRAANVDIGQGSSTPARIDAAFRLGIELDKQNEDWTVEENCRWLLLSEDERAAEIAKWIPIVQDLIDDFGQIRDPRMRYAMQSSFRKRLDRLMNAVESDDSPFTL